MTTTRIDPATLDDDAILDLTRTILRNTAQILIANLEHPSDDGCDYADGCMTIIAMIHDSAWIAASYDLNPTEIQSIRDLYTRIHNCDMLPTDTDAGVKCIHFLASDATAPFDSLTAHDWDACPNDTDS